MTTVVGKVRDLALAPPTAPGAPAPAAVAALSAAVRDALTAGIPVVIGFVAKQTNLDTLPTAVVGALRKLQDLPRTKIKAALGTLVTKVKDKLGLAGPHATEYQGLIGPVVTFAVGGEEHRLWVVNQNGRAVILRASSPSAINSVEDFLRGLVGVDGFDADKQKILRDNFKALVDAAGSVIAGGSGVPAALEVTAQRVAQLTKAEKALVAALEVHLRGRSHARNFPKHMTI